MSGATGNITIESFVVSQTDTEVKYFNILSGSINVKLAKAGIFTNLPAEYKPARNTTIHMCQPYNDDFSRNNHRVGVALNTEGNIEMKFSASTSDISHMADANWISTVKIG